MKIFLTTLILVSVQLAHASVELDVSSRTPLITSQVTVSWFSSDATSEDWIGLYAVGHKDDIFHPSIAWQETKGSANGQMTFTMPQNPGAFEFRYFRGDGYDVIARSPALQTHRDQLTSCLAPGATRSNIKHVVVIIQENHSFDSYFGSYCKAPVGSNPTCTTGSDCCEMAPLTEPATGARRTKLSDLENVFHDPNHNHDCEVQEINGGKMDRFVAGAGSNCSDPKNFAVVDNEVVRPYWQLASQYALADRYFQPLIGASSSNDMYFARGSYVFTDNDYVPDAEGTACYSQSDKKIYTDPTVGDLLAQCDVPWGFFAEGYRMVLDEPFHLGLVCEGIVYDPTDNPFQYYANFRDNFTYMKDYQDFNHAVSHGTLPAVSYIKPIEVNNEHPSFLISEGVGFATRIVDRVLSSPEYKDNTLVLLTVDESGGFYDHVAPPSASQADNEPYGARIFLLALGNFAKKNYVSHVVMEHTSILKFIEWNFLGGDPGQLHTRDALVNNIGDLLDPEQTGALVPSN